MEQVMVIDEKFKRRMFVICHLPSVAFLFPVIYYCSLLLPLLHGHPEPKSIVGITARHYDTMFLLLAMASTISAAVLIYCVAHLARTRTMNKPQKMIWILFLLIVPVSFIVFWHRVINHEPRNMPVNPDMG